MGLKRNLISYHPVQEKKYKKDWTNYGDWLGTNTVANKNRDFLPFQEARGFVSKLGLNSQLEWFNMQIWKTAFRYTNNSKHSI